PSGRPSLPPPGPPSSPPPGPPAIWLLGPPSSPLPDPSPQATASITTKLIGKRGHSRVISSLLFAAGRSTKTVLCSALKKGGSATLCEARGLAGARTEPRPLVLKNAVYRPATGVAGVAICHLGFTRSPPVRSA